MRERDREALRNGMFGGDHFELQDVADEAVADVDSLRVENDRLAEALATAEAEILDLRDEVSELNAHIANG